MSLFLALMVYLVYFNVARARTIIASPYNERTNAFADRIIRGSILDRNGNVLAQTEVGEDTIEQRVYPYGSVFAHVIGYNSAEFGRVGLEMVENADLLTSNAFFLEKFMNEFRGEKNMGDTVITTLDAELQMAAYNALGANRGAIVVTEASTGKILAMVSNPTFDPNSIDATWPDMNVDYDNSPLLNRATQGSYAPGSTFKVVTTLEYMRENPDYANYLYDCYGSITAEGVTINCYNQTAHGLQDLRSSLANSCNSSYANIGLSLNKAQYRATAEELLFNKQLPSVLEYTKSSFSVNESTTIPDIMMTAMGQGETMVSPYHMALITAAVANGGILMEPYLVERVTNYTGAEIRKTVPKSFKKLMSADEAAQLKDYMRAVVDEGTASLFAGQSYTVAGKTGTAEYSMVDSDKAHSWFIGFTNVDNPELVISVVIEGFDGYDDARAVPIAKQVLDSYYY